MENSSLIVKLFVAYDAIYLLAMIILSRLDLIEKVPTQLNIVFVAIALIVLIAALIMNYNCKALPQGIIIMLIVLNVIESINLFSIG